MTLFVEILAPGRAMIFREPSLLARLLFRRQGTARGAAEVLVITGGFRWVYETTRGVEYVEPDAVRALAEAVRAARRPLVFHAVEPPG